MDMLLFRKRPVLGILRGAGYRHIGPLIETVIENGLKALEITMNTEDEPRLIQKAKRASRGRLFLGAGTVLTMKDLKGALKSGATFIVMPVLIEEIVSFCVKEGVPVFPGALTPQEIYRAWDSGATMVKVFPVKLFGPQYIKEIKAPLNNVEILACSGVTPRNLKDYFLSGASAVSFGSSVFSKELLDRQDYDAVGLKVKEFMDCLPEGRTDELR